MSGWSSKADAMNNLRGTIIMNAGLPSQDPRDYYIGSLFDDLYYRRREGGWSMAKPSYEEFVDAATSRLRPKARVRANLTAGSEPRCP